MNKNRQRIFAILAVVLLILIVLFISKVLHERQRMIEKFEESNKELSNPERGYYWQVPTSRKEKFSELEEEGYRLVLLTFDLWDVRNEAISQERLQELEEALEEASKHHIAIIFRAAYGFEEIPGEPEKLETIGAHITQIAAVLNEHRDNIICVQAGLLGAYGEWHSGHFLTQSEKKAKTARKYVLTQWEENLAEEIEVAVRRPRFIREAEGILVNRLGIHNDALLSTYDDMGTYDDTSYNRQAELKWAEKALLLRKNGGEMPLLCENSQPDHANYEFGKLHITYLNRSYQEAIFEEWKTLKLNNQNAETYINNHLGYRLHIAQIERWKEISKFPFSLFPIAFKIKLVNSGYAPLGNKYKMYLAVASDEKDSMQEASVEELYSICNNQAITIQLHSGILPKELEGKKVRIGIKIAEGPEAEEKDSIRLANEEFLWQDGVNWLFEYELN